MRTTTNTTLDEFFQTLPNYEQETSRIWQTIIVMALICMGLLPLWCSKLGISKTKESDKSNTKNKNSKSKPPPQARRNKALTLIGFLGIGFLVWMVIVLVLVLYCSPYNTYIPRRVFVVPVLSRQECTQLVNMAHQAAQANFHAYLQSPHRRGQASTTTTTSSRNPTAVPELIQPPIGWRKENGPTAHLHLQDDPFDPQARQWLTQHVLDTRLGPTLSRLYGVPVSTLIATDLYIIRYDADFWVASMAKHVDAGDITYSILLYENNNEEEDEESDHDTNDNDDNGDAGGGGTLFWNRSTQQPLAHVQPPVGSLVAFTANMLHEEVAVQKGTRIMLLGNMRIESVPTNTAAAAPRHWVQVVTATTNQWLATWFNVAWLTTRLKHEVHTSFSLVPTAWHGWLQNTVAPWLQAWTDAYSPHVVEQSLVVEEDNAIRYYWQALEAAYDPAAPKATWWKQQQQQQTPPPVNNNNHHKVQSSSETVQTFPPGQEEL